MIRVSLILLLLILSGCGKPIVKTQVVRFDIGKEANNNFPIALDLVLVYDVEIAKQLLELSAQEWFETREQIKRDQPRALITFEWELVPGQEIPTFKMPEAREDAKVALLFANYTTPGLHRARLDPYPAAIVRLGKNEFEVVALRGR